MAETLTQESAGQKAEEGQAQRDNADHYGRAEDADLDDGLGI